MIIDISHHNGNIKWGTVAKTVDSVFIKATEGSTFKDPKLKLNAQNAAANALNIGYYHFGTLNSSNVVLDAINEAEWFLDAIQTLPVPTLPLVLDIETNKKKIKPHHVLMYIQTFFKQLPIAGYKDYALYSYAHFLNSNLPKNHPLGNIKMWVAKYNNPLVIPKGWDKIYLHQYTDKGKVQGIIGNVDLNRTV